MICIFSLAIVFVGEFSVKPRHDEANVKRLVHA